MRVFRPLIGKQSFFFFGDAFFFGKKNQNFYITFPVQKKRKKNNINATLISKNIHHRNCNPFHRPLTRSLRYYISHYHTLCRRWRDESALVIQSPPARLEPSLQTRSFSMVFPICVYDGDSFRNQPMTRLMMIHSCYSGHVPRLL